MKETERNAEREVLTTGKVRNANKIDENNANPQSAMKAQCNQEAVLAKTNSHRNQNIHRFLTDLTALRVALCSKQIS